MTPPAAHTVTYGLGAGCFRGPDPRYFNIENWEPAPGLGEGLHLHARRITLPLGSGKRLDVSAPLPPHMQQTFDALGFNADRYDLEDEDPET